MRRAATTTTTWCEPRGTWDSRRVGGARSSGWVAALAGRTFGARAHTIAPVGAIARHHVQARGVGVASPPSCACPVPRIRSSVSLSNRKPEESKKIHNIN